MKTKSKLGLGMLLGLVLGLSLGTIYSVSADSHQNTALPLEELRTFSDVYARIKNDYVEDVDDETLMQNAIRGMLSGLDPHSNYLDIDEFKELRIGTTGKFGGLGIEVGMEDGFVKVISPIDDTPAQKAGIQAGDLIIRLDDTPVKGLTLNDAVDIMRGEPGSDILLTIIREGESQPLKITVTRDQIRIQSVKSRILEADYGYLRVSSFQSGSSKLLRDHIKKLKKENGDPLKGVVLDLRNNPGGVLSGAVEISDAFLNDGLIVYTEGRIDDSKLSYSATDGDLIDGAPLIVLVNGGSASASEIVAGALQDHKRAIIMGQQTFGKGSVQTILPLRSDDALKLTTARYFTPSGRSIQAQGVVPDIPLEQLKLAATEEPLFDSIKESNLSGHLSNGSDAPDADNKKKEAEEESLAQSDFELFEALNMLKGMAFLAAAK